MVECLVYTEEVSGSNPLSFNMYNRVRSKMRVCDKDRLDKGRLYRSVAAYTHGRVENYGWGVIKRGLVGNLNGRIASLILQTEARGISKRHLKIK